MQLYHYASGNSNTINRGIIIWQNGNVWQNGNANPRCHQTQIDYHPGCFHRFQHNRLTAPYLFLYSPNGNKILDGGANEQWGKRNAVLKAKLPVDGIYVILANSKSAEEVGSYSIRAAAKTNSVIAASILQTVMSNSDIGVFDSNYLYLLLSRKFRNLKI